MGNLMRYDYGHFPGEKSCCREKTVRGKPRDGNANRRHPVGMEHDFEARTWNESTMLGERRVEKAAW